MRKVSKKREVHAQSVCMYVCYIVGNRYRLVLVYVAIPELLLVMLWYSVFTLDYLTRNNPQKLYI